MMMMMMMDNDDDDDEVNKTGHVAFVRASLGSWGKGCWCMCSSYDWNDSHAWTKETKFKLFRSIVYYFSCHILNKWLSKMMKNIRVCFPVTETWGTRALLGAPSTGGDSSRVHDELQDVVQVSASEGAFAAIRADGSAVVWGSAEAGGDATGHLEELLGQFEKQVFHFISTWPWDFISGLFEGFLIFWWTLWPDLSHLVQSFSFVWSCPWHLNCFSVQGSAVEYDKFWPQMQLLLPSKMMALL